MSFSGKLGEIVGCRGPKGHYIRSAAKPSKRAPSPLQLIIQKKMALAAGLLSPARKILDETFTRKEKRYSSGYGAAMSHLLQTGFTGEFPDLIIDYSKVLLSSGNLPRTRPEITALANLSLLLKWEPSDHRDFNGWNTAALIIYSQDRNDYVLLRSQAQRRDGLATVKIPESFLNQTLHFYFFFEDIYSKKASCSQYLGSYLFNH